MKPGQRSRPSETPAEAPQGAEFRDDGRRHASLPPEVVRRLTVMNPMRATLAVFETFGLLAAAIAAGLYWWHPVVVVPAVIFIATRQHETLALIFADPATI